ncbi:MAG: hypothetical protein GC205_05695 [Bacteroidetes bacterium]|nr:hypothetical protein [Bacteroidota bacterium]
MAELLRSWQDVAHILGAELDYADNRDHQTREEAITMRVRHRHWTIEFESRTNSKGKEQTDAYTRISCSLPGANVFSFNIFEGRLKHRLFKIMGLQDIIIGDAALDRRFIIQADEEAHLKRFLLNPMVRAGLASPYVQQLRLGQNQHPGHSQNLGQSQSPGLGSEQGQGPGQNQESSAQHGPLTHQLYGRTERRMHAKAEILAHFQLFAAALDGLYGLELIPEALPANGPKT